jgi:hypothetical protein
MSEENLSCGKSFNNSKNIFELIELIEPSTWNLSKITVPWTEAEKKLEDFGKFFKCTIDINDYRDFL